MHGVDDTLDSNKPVARHALFPVQAIQKRKGYIKTLRASAGAKQSFIRTIRAARCSGTAPASSRVS